MNCLSLSLNKAAEEGKFGYHHNCSNVKLTHLSFADDLLIFCEGSLSSVQGVITVLRDFESRSGLALSIEKTSFFSGGLSDQEVCDISSATGISSANLPVRYLEIPLCTKKLNASHCTTLIQTIKNRLQSWATKSLSYAGRVQLISTVIAGITNFWASSFILPIGIINDINSLCGRFLWKGSIEQKTSAKVAWETVTSPKSEGGLGLKNLRLWNTACALRMIWLLFFSPHSIWAIWFTQEILEGNVDNLWIINTKQKHTWLTNELINLRENIYDWISVEVGNGETTLFWSSNWSPFGKLETFLNSNGLGRSGIPRNATLSDLWTGSGWVVPAARTNCQANVQCHLSTVSLTDQEDKYIWKPGGRVQERFKTGEVYNLLRVPNGDVSWHREIWFSGGIPRQKFMMWLVMLNRCPTKDRLLSWGLQIDPVCLLCNSDTESKSHLYFACPFSATVWSGLSHRCGFRRLISIDQVLDEIRVTRWDKRQKTLLLMVLHAAVYHLWGERNSRMHSSRFRGVEEILRDIDSQIRCRIQSLRDTNQTDASFMLQSWFSTAAS